LSTMSPRQRVLTAVGLKEPDRVPIDLGGTGATSIDLGAYEDLKAHLGVTSETQFIYKRSQVARPAEEILERFSVDTRRVIPKTARYEVGARDLTDETYVDEWGVVYRLAGSGFPMPISHPFADKTSPADIKHYPWPDPDDPIRLAGVSQSAAALHAHTDYAVIMQVPSRVFSFGEALCGMEKWLMDLATEPRFAGALLEKGLDLQLRMTANLLSAAGDNVDIVACADDFAGQEALLISPEMYRRLIKPRQKRLFDAIRSHSKARLWMHISGSAYDLLPDFIEMGLDILNPVHVSAAGMADTRQLKREFGKDIAFWGAIDTQRVLAFGTPADVCQEVRRRIDDLAPGGGYVVSSIQNIPPGTPPENICAMFNTALEYGRY